MNKDTSPVVRRLTLAVGGILASTAAQVGLVGTPAYGSCYETAVRSPHAFTGVVVDVEAQDRVATVKTDDGTTVTVIGTPAASGITSVDRTFEVGVRYEFHPWNASSPFEDNNCTATHPLLAEGASKGGSSSGGTATGEGLQAPKSGPAKSGSSTQTGSRDATTAGWNVLGATAAAVSLGGIYFLMHRRRPSTHNQA